MNRGDRMGRSDRKGIMDPRDYGVAVISYSDEETGLVFRWHGGAYIDVCPFGGQAEDVLNVWDDELDESTFEIVAYEGFKAGSIRRPFRDILESFEIQCAKYIAESAEVTQ